MRHSKVRQEDIARVVGVSVSTVSRVLSGAPGISPATTQKVLRAAADLGTPITLPGDGGGLVTHRMERALLFLKQVDLNSGSGSIYHFVMTGIQKAARKYGLRVELALLGEDGEIPERILGGAETGVLFAGVDPSPKLLKKLRETGNSAVLVNGLDPSMTHDQVAPNNYQGGWLAAQHFLDMGHRRILQLGTARRLTLAARTQGFLDAIAQAGMDGLDCDFIEIGNVTEQAAQVALKQILSESAFPYTAVFCSADIVALTVMQELRMREIDVPREVSLLGFNGLPLAEFSSPLLSTLYVDWEYLGHEAIRLLCTRSAEPDRPTQQVQTQVILKQAETVADLSNRSDFNALG
ncbi:LacI family DNA-binding transcriptional regulator [Vannielia litorea]|uniref:Transcriptional regulator, LacI family n=1 Tax=Vannielia litorea TaxID=1217970 RepID=A0A1N6EYN9_9RHOB|nr:LacI family DNA-binding transcriptional regulator [Vannielia litorea]SIN88129.1 transcriptional regulator, LacI family [Vannielia litorea]